jgi:hypothetical protein
MEPEDESRDKKQANQHSKVPFSLSVLHCEKIFSDSLFNAKSKKCDESHIVSVVFAKLYTVTRNISHLIMVQTWRAAVFQPTRADNCEFRARLAPNWPWGTEFAIKKPKIL